jgi:hypothetical protein
MTLFWLQHDLCKESFSYLFTTISNNCTTYGNISFLHYTSYTLLQWPWTCTHCQCYETCFLNVYSHYKRIFMASNMVGIYHYFIIFTFKWCFCSMNLSMWLYMYHSHHIHTTWKKCGNLVLDWLPTISQVIHIYIHTYKHTHIISKVHKFCHTTVRHETCQKKTRNTQTKQIQYNTINKCQYYSLQKQILCKT